VISALELLVLKLVIAPTFVGITSLVALRYGHGVAGWLVALPISTGTIILVLTFADGPRFAAVTALGALTGTVSVAAFVIGYARSASRYRWPICLGVAAGGFAASTTILSQVPALVGADLLGAVLALLVALVLVPGVPEPAPPPAPPRWEIPARMLTAAVLVLVITTAAAGLGARLSGLLSPIPVFTITLAIFTHSRYGPAYVFVFLGGLLRGMFSFAAFCAVVGVLLVPFGLADALSLGLAALFVTYALVRWISGRFVSRDRSRRVPSL